MAEVDTCTCSSGTAATGASCASDGENIGASCYAGFSLNGNAWQALIYLFEYLWGLGYYILGRGFRMVDLHTRTEGAISLSQIPAGLDLPHTYAGGGRYIPVPKSRWV